MVRGHPTANPALNWHDRPWSALYRADLAMKYPAQIAKVERLVADRQSNPVKCELAFRTRQSPQDWHLF